MDSNVVNNFVKVSQEHTHVVVKGAGGLQGLPGPAGAGLKIDGSVDTYSELPHHLVPEDAGVAYFVQEDGLLYVWSGTKWPEEGEGAQFQGPRGVQGIQGEQGVPGEPGADGEPGPRGPDGFSPTVTTEDIEAGIRINITNKSGTTSTDIDYRTIPDGVITTSKLNDGAVTTSKIANSAVTSAKIDWTTMAEITESGTNPTGGGAGNYQMCIRYPNGLQIITGYYSDDETLYKNNTADKTIIFAKPFSALPNVVVGLQSDSTSPDMGNITVSTCTTSTTQFIARCFYYNAGSAGRRPAIRWTAIGRWS